MKKEKVSAESIREKSIRDIFDSLMDDYNAKKVSKKEFLLFCNKLHSMLYNTKKVLNSSEAPLPPEANGEILNEGK